MTNDRAAWLTLRALTLTLPQQTVLSAVAAVCNSAGPLERWAVSAWLCDKASPCAEEYWPKLSAATARAIGRRLAM